jgi:predicted RNase H-like HicB family nuclease
MTYKVALKQTDEGVSVWVPGMPGCWSQGATEQEALANIREAIREYLQVAQELLGDQEVREVEIAA